MSDKDYEQIYLDNELLVYKFATKYYLLKDEDMLQSLKLAMYRAIISYDSSKGYTLSTYIYKVLYNEYCYHFRDKNLKIKYTSNSVIDENGKSSDIFDFIADDKNKDVDSWYKKYSDNKIGCYYGWDIVKEDFYNWIKGGMKDDRK